MQNNFKSVSLNQLVYFNKVYFKNYNIRKSFAKHAWGQLPTQPPPSIHPSILFSLPLPLSLSLLSPTTTRKPKVKNDSFFKFQKRQEITVISQARKRMDTGVPWKTNPDTRPSTGFIDLQVGYQRILGSKSVKKLLFWKYLAWDR